MNHYKVTNTTKFPDARKGPHKNGFFVSILPGKMMGPGRHLIVEKITPGIMAMQRKRYISIAQIEDITLEIKKEVEQVEKINAAEKATQLKDIKTKAAASAKVVKDTKEKAEAEAKALKEDSLMASSFDKQEMKDKVKASSAKNFATISGDGVQGNGDPLGDLEEAVSPDGEPNFVVKAGKKRKSKKS